MFSGEEAEDKVSLVRGEEQVIYRYHINYFFKNLTYRKDKERMTIPRLGYLKNLDDIICHCRKVFACFGTKREGSASKVQRSL